MIAGSNQDPVSRGRPGIHVHANVRTTKSGCGYRAERDRKDDKRGPFGYGQQDQRKLHHKLAKLSCSLV
jgi:hypothetical protein